MTSGNLSSRYLRRQFLTKRLRADHGLIIVQYLTVFYGFAGQEHRGKTYPISIRLIKPVIEDFRNG